MQTYKSVERRPETRYNPITLAIRTQSLDLLEQPCITT